MSYTSNSETNPHADLLETSRQSGKKRDEYHCQQQEKMRQLEAKRQGEYREMVKSTVELFQK